MSEIVIRHAEPGDAEALHRMMSQPETYRDTLQLPHPALKVWQDRAAVSQAGLHRLVACIEGKVVGDLTLEVNSRARRRHTASFGIAVDYDYRGKGVAKALMQEMISLCDSWLEVARIELTVFADNATAIALYEKFGFVTEGVARRFAVRDGRQVDALYMARLKDKS
ncbi:GNAT family N-acetyltransferase [Erwinia pyri]|uniref:GNAT family N-acetyltransferase n=1 Tax=Erwinia pyri TaxID=3062598 RepID=A0AA50HQN8_9GAMM|nr:GNAT family N-acetyltransferase [Erwinia sp. DE2]WLS79235.1 GNAT family N-acetyltransferase [Erwinia sp. DE2]